MAGHHGVEFSTFVFPVEGEGFFFKFSQGDREFFFLSITHQLDFRLSSRFIFANRLDQVITPAEYLIIVIRIRW